MLLAFLLIYRSGYVILLDAKLFARTIRSTLPADHKYFEWHFSILQEIHGCWKGMFLAYEYGLGTQGPGTILSSKVVRMRKKRKRCAAEVCARGIQQISKLTTLVPFLTETDLGTKLKKLKHRTHFQILGLAVGHGQPKKPLKNDTLWKWAKRAEPKRVRPRAKRAETKRVRPRTLPPPHLWLWSLIVYDFDWKCIQAQNKWYLLYWFY